MSVSEDMLLELERAARLTPSDPGAGYRWAVALAQSARGAEALQVARRATSQVREPRLSADLAELLDLLGAPEDARAVLRRSVLQAPELAETHLRLAQHLIAHGELRAATLAVRAALERHPREPALHAAHAESLMGLGELSAAARALDEAGQQGLPPQSHLRMGARLAERRGDFDGALQALARLEPLQASDFGLACSVAQALAATGQRMRAQALIDRMLTHSPESVTIQLALCETALALGLPSRALGVLRNLARTAPERGEVRRALGQALIALGAQDEGVGELKLAERLGARGRSTWLPLGRALLELGRVDEAIETLSHALRDGATDEDAREALWLALSRASRRPVADDRANRPSRPPERMALWAELSTTALPELLQLLATQRTSGTLFLDGPRGAARLELLAGDLVGARWPGGSSLRDALIESTLVSEGELRTVEAGGESDLMLARRLLESGLAEPQRLVDVIGARIVDAIAELARWTEGEASLVRMAEDVTGRLPFRVDVRWALLEAARHSDESAAPS